MSNKHKKNIIPVIDLFAGPGGLNEGFSHKIGGERRFKSVLSVEKEAPEHQTLSLRAFYRYFLYRDLPVPQEYYDYIQKRNNVTREQLWKKYPDAAAEADNEALQFTLGEDDGPLGFPFLADKIKKALGGEKNWLLIGGPPCQAYSLVGRSKQLGELKKTEGSISGAEQKFYQDHRHKLYRQYLRILAYFAPAVFVMENVKGILSAKLNGELIFPQIIDDLKTPAVSAKEYGWESNTKHTYHIFSFVTGTEPDDISDYLIKSENYGIPQARHRVILLGIRDDIWAKTGHSVGKLKKQSQTSVKRAIGKLPVLRSGFTRRDDNLDAWKNYLAEIINEKFFSEFSDEVKQMIMEYIRQRETFSAERTTKEHYKVDKELLDDWYSDPLLKCYLNHETRAHMAKDLYRYLFVAVMGELQKHSPQLKDFPDDLLPEHQNVIKNAERTEKKVKTEQKFADRFKVQVWDIPSSTITSHISKDGHYFIHPDPLQCRSLTVREAARLQTFPDNYFFEGNRTQQYHQVGNAVPPFLAHQLSRIVFDVFEKAVAKKEKK